MEPNQSSKKSVYTHSRLHRKISTPFEQSPKQREKVQTLQTVPGLSLAPLISITNRFNPPRGPGLSACSRQLLLLIAVLKGCMSEEVLSFYCLLGSAILTLLQSRASSAD